MTYTIEELEQMKSKYRRNIKNIETGMYACLFKSVKVSKQGIKEANKLIKLLKSTKTNSTNLNSKRRKAKC